MARTFRTPEWTHIPHVKTKNLYANMIFKKKAAQAETKSMAFSRATGKCIANKENKKY